MTAGGKIHTVLAAKPVLLKHLDSQLYIQKSGNEAKHKPLPTTTTDPSNQPPSSRTPLLKLALLKQSTNLLDAFLSVVVVGLVHICLSSRSSPRVRHFSWDQALPRCASCRDEGSHLAMRWYSAVLGSFQAYVQSQVGRLVSARGGGAGERQRGGMLDSEGRRGGA